jgi:hypothetical protein
MTLQHTGDLLFHCWSHADRQAGYKIFESIVEKGFLLTINSGPLDSFRYHTGGQVVQMDVMQLARVCFTEIPVRLLHTHGYGHFGVGFTANNGALGGVPSLVSPKSSRRPLAQGKWCGGYSGHTCLSRRA